MSEHQIQCNIIELAKLHEHIYPELKWLHAIPNGGNRNIVTAMKLKKEGVKRGVFDLFLPVPNKKYHGYYLEIKYSKNKLTGNQNEFKKFVESQGYKTGVFYDQWMAIDSLFDYLKDI